MISQEMFRAYFVGLPDNGGEGLDAQPLGAQCGMVGTFPCAGVFEANASGSGGAGSPALTIDLFGIVGEVMPEVELVRLEGKGRDHNAGRSGHR